MTDRHEALDRLRAINPVTTVDVLDPDEVASVAALCEERRLTPTSDAHDRPVAEPRTGFRTPVLAFAAAFVAIIVAVGVFGLLGRGGQTVVDEPAPPTTIHPMVTTTAAPVTTTALAAFSEDSSSAAFDTAIGHDGSLWAITSAGLVRWPTDGQTPMIYTVDDGLPFNDINSLEIAPGGTVWAGGSGWMARYDGSGQWAPMSAGGTDGPGATGPDGAVWAVSGRDRLLRFDGAEWETITVPDLLHDSSGLSGSLAVGPDGTVWAGTDDRGGVVSYDGTSFTHHEPGTRMPSGFGSTVVAVAPDGTAWVGAENVEGAELAGIASFDGNAWTVHTTENGLLANTGIVAIGLDGTVWAIHTPYEVATPGVSRFDGDGWTAFPGVIGEGMFASVDADGTLWMPAGDLTSIIGFDGASTTQLELPISETEVVVPEPSAGDWDPILTEARSKAPPVAATCPSGTDPNVPGPVGQDRPIPGTYSDQAADFDRTWGRIVLIDAHHDTWTFDVCANTWHELNADGFLPEGGSLVYDIDSDRSVLFGEGQIWVYDRDENTWEARHAPASDSIGWGGLSAIYDPQSGLIIVSIRMSPIEDDARFILSAYDVDTDAWTTLGLTGPTQWAILGYSLGEDRLVAMDVFSTLGTDLINPRTGVIESIDQDHPELVGGFGAVELANGADTVYGMAWGPDAHRNDICGFVSGSSGWECLPNVPNGRADGYRPYDAITYDWINGRLVFIGGEIDPWGPGEMTYFDDVWSMDPETGEWLGLLAPSADR